MSSPPPPMHGSHHRTDECGPETCGQLPMVAAAVPPGLCEHADCAAAPRVAVAVRILTGPAAPPPYGLCARCQWADAVALADGDERAALYLVAAADVMIDVPGAASAGATLMAGLDAVQRQPPPGLELALLPCHAHAPAYEPKCPDCRVVPAPPPGLPGPAGWQGAAGMLPGPGDEPARYHLDLALRALAGQEAALDAARAQRDGLADALTALGTRWLMSAAALARELADPASTRPAYAITRDWLTAHGIDPDDPPGGLAGDDTGWIIPELIRAGAEAGITPDEGVRLADDTVTDAGRELLKQAADALRSFSLRALSVRPFLEVPYRDAPSMTPWTRTIEPEARKAHDLSMVIRKHLKAAGVPR